MARTATKVIDPAAYMRRKAHTDPDSIRRSMEGEDPKDIEATLVRLRNPGKKVGPWESKSYPVPAMLGEAIALDSLIRNMMADAAWCVLEGQGTEDKSALYKLRAISRHALAAAAAAGALLVQYDARAESAPCNGEVPYADAGEWIAKVYAAMENPLDYDTIANVPTYGDSVMLT